MSRRHRVSPQHSGRARLGRGRRPLSRLTSLESLERRELLAWDFLYANGGLIIQTPDQGEVGSLKMDPVTNDILIDVNGSGVFQVTGARLSNLTAPIQVLVNVPPNSTAIIDNTKFTIDNAAGGFLANKQFFYDGGPGINNSFALTGRTGADDIFDVLPPVLKTGGARIRTGLTSFTGNYINLTGTFTINSSTGADVLNLLGTAGADSVLMNATNVQQFSAAPGFTPAHLVAYSGFEGFEVNAGAGADVYQLINLPGSLKINGEAGADNISVTLPFGGDIDYEGGADADTFRVLGSSQNDNIFLDSQTIRGVGTGVVRYNAVTTEILHVSGEFGNDNITLQMPVLLPPPFVGDVLPGTIIFFGDGPTSNGNDLVTILGTERTPNTTGDDTVTVGDITDGPMQLVKIEALYINGLSGNDTLTNNSLFTNSLLIGGLGDDVLTAVDADDILIGGPGLDEFDAGPGDDFLFADHDEKGFVAFDTGEDVDGGDDRDTGVLGNLVAQQFGDIEDVDNPSGFDDVSGERVSFSVEPINPTLHLYAETPALRLLEEALRTPLAVRALGQPGNLRGAFATFDAFTARGYANYLNRAVDTDGLNFWSSSGLSIEGVRASLAASFEYQQRRNAFTTRDWLRHFMFDTVRRNPTDAEFNLYATRLDSGTPRFTVALEILNTQEARDARIQEVYDNVIGFGPTARDRDAIRADMSAGLGIVDVARLVVQGNGAYLNHVIANNATPVGFVGGLYRDVLRRGTNFSLAEITGWTVQFTRGMTRDQIARAFLGSVEYRAQVVDGYYRSFLGRAPDAGGLNFFVGAMGAGLRAENVLASIIGSNEYLAKNGATSENYIRSLYSKVLQRPAAPSQGELDYWIGQLAISTRTAIQARTEVALSFQFSDEFRNIIVSQLYQRYLNRAPSTAERDNALDSLRVGFTQESIAAQLLVARAP